MSRPRCYLAMPVTAYSTAEETRATDYLTGLGFDVVSPTHPGHEATYRIEGMAYFEGIVRGCDALAFLPFADGMIGAGVAEEIDAAKSACIQILRAETGEEVECHDDVPPSLTVEETRARVASIRAEKKAA